MLSRYIVASDSYYVNHVQDDFINLLNEGSPEVEYYHFSSLASATKIADKINSESNAEDLGVFKVIPVNIE